MSATILREAIVAQYGMVSAANRVYRSPEAWSTAVAPGYSGPKAMAECIANALYQDRGANTVWQEPVAMLWGASCGLPVQPAVGGRYLTDDSGYGWSAHHIYEWDGSAWADTAPVPGMMVYSEYEERLYIYRGDHWIDYATSVPAGALDDLSDVTLTNPAAAQVLAYSGEYWYNKALTYSDVGAAASGHNHDSAYAALGHNHDSAYAASGHNHDSAYAALGHNHDSAYAAIGHDHSGVYDPAGTGHSEASAHVSEHESSYSHALLHAAATVSGNGISLSGQQISLAIGTGSTQVAAGDHAHSGVYDPAGTGHSEASAHVSAHESSYSHALLHAAATVSGNGISLSGQQISLAIGTGSTQVAAGDHGHTNLLAYLIHTGTADGADTSECAIAGGGAASGTRGAYVGMKGNQASSNPGFLDLVAGAVTNSRIRFVTQNIVYAYMNDSVWYVGLPGRFERLGLGTDADATASLKLNTIPAYGSAASVYLTSNGGAVVSRTTGQVLSDIGAAASGHNHDTRYARVDADSSVSGGILTCSTPDGNTMDVVAGGLSRLQCHQATYDADAFMTFHIANRYAAYFGLDATINDFAVGGWSMGAVAHRVWHAGNDGSGSGLDADLWDGNHFATYLNQSVKSDASPTLAGLSISSGGAVTADHLSETTSNHGVVVNCDIFDTPSFRSGHYSAMQSPGQANYWFKILTVSITAQYQYGAACLHLSCAGGSGSTNAGSASVYIRVKQQAALGGAPIVDVYTPTFTAALYPMDIVFVLTTNSGSLTEGSLYVRQRREYEITYWTAQNLTGNVSMTANNTAAVSALPSGTQYESYGGAGVAGDSASVYGRANGAAGIVLAGDNGDDTNDYVRLVSLAGLSTWDELSSGSWRSCFGVGAGGFCYAYGANLTTTSSAANLYVDSSSGIMRRSTSSRKYKGDIAALSAAESERIYALRPVSFRPRKQFYDDDELDSRGKRVPGGRTGTHRTVISDELEPERHIGLIAEEVADVMPEVVSYLDGKPDGVQYDRLVAPMIEELKQLRERIAKLEGARK